MGADKNSLEERGAIEAGAGGFPLLALDVVESDGGARDGEFGLGFLFFGAAERGEIPEHALEGSLSGGFVAVEESELVVIVGRPFFGSGLRGIARGFDGVVGALSAPEKPAGERGVFDEIARVGSFGRIFSEQIVEESVEIFAALARYDQLFGSAAVRGGVAT